MARVFAAVSLFVISGCTLSVIAGVEDDTSSGSGSSTGTSTTSGGTTAQLTATGSGTASGGRQGSTGQLGSTGGSSGSSTGTSGGSITCRFVLSPSQLNFGNERVGASAQLSFGVTNIGSNACLVQSLAIQDDVSGSFNVLSTSIQGGPDGITIPAPATGVTSRLTVQLGFTPSSSGALSAEAVFSVAGSSDPNQVVTLAGTSEPTCLRAAPSSLSFGIVGENDAGVLCGSASLAFTVFDTCSTTATLQALSLQSGPGDLVPQFSAPSGPTLPYNFETTDGGGATYQVFFQPTVSGLHTAQILVSDGTVTSAIELSGDAVATETITDTFRVGPPKADVLFVLDVADESESESDLLDAGPGFFQQAGAVDFRIALTTDNVDSSVATAELGRLLPCPTCSILGAAPTIISPSSVPPGGSSADPAAAFARLVGAVPTRGYPSKPPDDKQFFAAFLDTLLNGPAAGVNFFRPGVPLVAVTVNDDNEDDSSLLGAGGHDADWYATFYEAFFAGTPGFSWNYVNAGTTSTGTGFTDQSLLPDNIQQMLSVTGGFAVNTSDPSWGSALDSLWETIIANAGLYRLADTPSQGKTGMVVTVNGVAINPEAAPGDPNWTYLPARNAIVFTPQVGVKIGDTIGVTFPAGCP